MHQIEMVLHSELLMFIILVLLFVFFGWLEKESVNEGNEKLIEPEIMSKVPPLLEEGRYFPNGDHGLQPFITFPNLCRFMTLLHEVCRNPEGEFPRV